MNNRDEEMSQRWKDITEKDIDRLCKEGVDVLGCDNGFQFL